MIYFIQSTTGPIKIGRAQNAVARLQELQVANPYGLVLCGYFCPEKDGVTDQQIEQRTHIFLKDYELSGEWFKNCVPVCDEVMRLMRQKNAVLLVPPLVGEFVKQTEFSEFRKFRDEINETLGTIKLGLKERRTVSGMERQLIALPQVVSIAGISA